MFIDYPNLSSGLPGYLSGIVNVILTRITAGAAHPTTPCQLQAAILDFIAAFGAAYDGDPRIAFVQWGLLGFWGEWHTYPHTDWFADDAFQQAVIAAFDDAFETTLFRYAIPLKIRLSVTLGSMTTATPMPLWVRWGGSSGRVLSSGAEPQLDEWAYGW